MASARPRSKLSRVRRAASLSAESIGIVGHGRFATALATLLPGRDRTAVMYVDDDAIRRDINVNRRNRARLPGVSLARLVIATDDLADLAATCKVIVLAVSSRRVVEAVRALGPHLRPHHTVAHAIGALAGDDRRVSLIVRNHTAVTRIAALAGPALPADLIARRSTALVIAADDDDVAAEVKHALEVPPALRLYKSGDLLGVELAAALSGAMTVALGVADGLAIGDGPRTVFLTRALWEIDRLCRATGGHERTAFGLAGLGNLLIRASSESRADSVDYQFGLALGRGEARPRGDTEGVRALATGCRIADLLGIPSPIFRAIHEIVGGELGLDAAADRLAWWQTDLE